MANSSLTLAQARRAGRHTGQGVGRSGNARRSSVLRRRRRSSASCAGRRSAEEQSTCLEFLVDQARRFADPAALVAFAAGPANAVKPSADPAPASPREPGPRAVQPQRLSDGPLERRVFAMKSETRHHPARLSAASAPRPFWPTSAWASPAWRWARCCWRDGICRASDTAAWHTARRPAAFSAQGQERDLALPDRRHEPPGELRSQAGAQRIRRQDDRRDAAQGRADRVVRATRTCGSSCPTTPTATFATSCFPLQVGFQKRGQSGLEVSDWWPHLGSCADDLAVVRSMWTTDNNHGAQLQFHTGRHVLEGQFPTIGSWVHYGLGSLNDNLPQFVVLGTPLADCCGGIGAHGANYLGPEHAGVQLAVDPTNPLPFAAPGSDVFREEQQGEFDLLGRLNRLSAVEYPDDPALRARIKSYELAFRMQTAVPDVVAFEAETAGHAQALRPRPATRPRTFGRQCLAARRLVERGVRFVQIFHGIQRRRRRLGRPRRPEGQPQPSSAAQVDQPIAALLKDLKQRGLLDETMLVVGTEFGRTPGTQGSRRPRPSSVRLLGLAGRRRPQRRHRPRRDRRAGLPRRREPPLRHRHPRHGPAPAGPRPPAPRSPRPQAAGDRLRPADSRDHRLRTSPSEPVTRRPIFAERTKAPARACPAARRRPGRRQRPRRLPPTVARQRASASSRDQRQ